MNERFSKTERLRRREDIRRILREQGVSGKYCVIHVKGNEESISRFAMVVNRKIGKAVLRNRVKRRLREIFRRLKSHFLKTVDVVVRAKPDIKNATYDEMNHEMITLLQQKNVLAGRERKKDYSSNSNAN